VHRRTRRISDLIADGDPQPHPPFARVFNIDPEVSPEQVRHGARANTA
jgi:hypothetical protein